MRLTLQSKPNLVLQILFAILLPLSWGSPEEVHPLPDGSKIYYKTLMQHKDTVLHGRIYRMSVKGVLLHEWHWLAGAPHGLERRFDTSGRLRQIHQWEKGMRHGLSRQISPKGIILSEGNYKLGLRTGKWLFNHPNGEVKEIIWYKEGLREGLYLEYYADKTPKTQCNYQKNVLHGEFRSWYPSGKQHLVCQFQSGKTQEKDCKIRDINGLPLKWGNLSEGYKSTLFSVPPPKIPNDAEQGIPQLSLPDSLGLESLPEIQNP